MEVIFFNINKSNNILYSLTKRGVLKKCGYTVANTIYHIQKNILLLNIELILQVK